MYTKFIIRTFTSHISFTLVDRKHTFSRIYDLREFFPFVQFVLFFFPIFRTACKRKAVKSGRFEKHMLADIRQILSLLIFP